MGAALIFDSDDCRFVKTGEEKWMFGIVQSLSDCRALVYIRSFLTSCEDWTIIPTTNPLRASKQNLNNRQHALPQTRHSTLRHGRSSRSGSINQRTSYQLFPPLPTTSPSSSPSRMVRSCLFDRLDAVSNRARGFILDAARLATGSLLAVGSESVWMRRDVDRWWM
jgi:hypothetical protein